VSVHDEPGTQRRLHILDDEELEALYGRPCFSADDRADYFTLEPAEMKLLRSLRGVASQVACLLQLGYFKAKQLFFTVRFEEVTEDVAYVLAHYFPQVSQASLRSLNTRTLLKQHHLLLAHFGYRRCGARERTQLAGRASRAARLNSKQVYVFRELLQYLTEQRITAPGYTVLQDIVGTVLTVEQARLETILRTDLTPEDCIAVDRLLGSTSGLHPITLLKRDPKDFSLGEMRTEIGRATDLRPLAQLADRLLPRLDISNEGIKYYASLARYYSLFRLRQLDTHTAYLYLLCFAFHRYQRVHDHLLTCFLHKVKGYADDATTVAKDRAAAQQVAAQHDLPRAGAVLTLFTVEQGVGATPFSVVQAQAFAILDRTRLERVADHLANAARFDEAELHWEHVDKLALLFKRHLRPLLQAVEIAASQPETPVLAAISFLKTAFAKGQTLSQLAEGSFPTHCIPKRLRRYLYAQTGRGPRRLLVNRYEFWVYRLLRQGLEDGSLSCRQSVRFRSFEDDVIPEEEWRQHKEALLAGIGLPVLSRPITEQLADLEHHLEDLLQAVNRRIATGENIHFQVTRRTPTLRWTLATPRPGNTVNHPIFETLPQRDIAGVLLFVQSRCPFLHAFDHLLPRYTKQAADDRVLCACLVAWGTNTGLGRMGETSDISYQDLQAASDNYLRLETLGPANDLVINGMAALPITHLYDLGGLVHSSSDGQKFETRRPTFNARHGPKYFGLKKGIVVDTLVINHIPVTARVIGANEHESHYVFDLLFNNTTSLRPDVHSTDTHGTNEVNFALLHTSMYQFAPRYADIPEKVRTSLFGFQHPSQYAGLTLRPMHKANTTLIVEEWDNVLRILVSLARKTTSQSIIVSKLSAYARRNKTRRALWEFDAILRSIYLLTYIDSPPMRRNVQHALNRGENYHQLRRAVSYANFGKLRFKSEEEQQIWSECSRLITNCILYYNATILSELLAQKVASGDTAGVEALKGIALAAWGHVNLHGRFEFTKRTPPIDLQAIVQQMAQHPIAPDDAEP